MSKFVKLCGCLVSVEYFTKTSFSWPLFPPSANMYSTWKVVELKDELKKKKGVLVERLVTLIIFRTEHNGISKCNKSNTIQF